MAITEGLGHERCYECGWCGKPIADGEPWAVDVTDSKERQHIACAAEDAEDANFDNYGGDH